MQLQQHVVFTCTKNRIFSTGKKQNPLTVKLKRPRFELGSCWGFPAKWVELSWVEFLGPFLNVPDFHFRVNSGAVFETFRGCLFFWLKKKTCKFLANFLATLTPFWNGFGVLPFPNGFLGEGVRLHRTEWKFGRENREEWTFRSNSLKSPGQ